MYAEGRSPTAEDPLKHFAGDEPDSTSEGAESSSSSDDVTLASLMPTAPPVKASQAPRERKQKDRVFFFLGGGKFDKLFFLPGKLLRRFTFMLFKWIV